MRSSPFYWPLVSRATYALWRKRYTGGLRARLRSIWHHVIKGYRYEVCGQCGRPVDVVWEAPTELWQEVMGDPRGLICIPCFDGELEQRGLFARWVPEVGA